VFIRVAIKLELASHVINYGLESVLRLSTMSATSGITVSPELASTFADAVSSKNVRFLKISIQNGLHDS